MEGKSFLIRKQANLGRECCYSSSSSWRILCSSMPNEHPAVVWTNICLLTSESTGFNLIPAGQLEHILHA